MVDIYILFLFLLKSYMYILEKWNSAKSCVLKNETPAVLSYTPAPLLRGRCVSFF